MQCRINKEPVAADTQLIWIIDDPKRNPKNTGTSNHTMQRNVAVNMSRLSWHSWRLLLCVFIHPISMFASQTMYRIFWLLIIDVFAVNISWSADWKHMPIRDMEVEGRGRGLLGGNGGVTECWRRERQREWNLTGRILTPSFYLNQNATAHWLHALSCVLLLFPLLSLPSPLLQGSQDSTGGQEGLVAPPFSAFPPPPPPQNGLPGTEFGPGAMFAAGGQGTAEVGAGANGATTTTTTNSNNVSTMCS